MDRAYENDKTLALAKNHGFKPVVSPKKNVNLLASTINSFINIAILSNDIS